MQATGGTPPTSGFQPFVPGQTPQASPPPAAPPTSAPASPGFFGQIKDAFMGGVNQAKEGIDTIRQGAAPIPAAEAGLKIESGIASAVSSPLSPLFAPVNKAISAVADKVGNIPAVQKFAMSPAGKTTARVAGDLANAGNVAGTIAGVDQIVKAAPKVSGAVADTSKTIKSINSVADTLTPKAPNPDAIVSAYNKAIKPTVAGKTGPGQLDAYNGSVVSAVKSITNNQPKLSFETDTGTEAGRLPQTRAELADAVAQTKQSLFKQYDALAKQTSGQGVQIPLEKAGNALNEVVSSEALKLTNPGAVQYAKDMQSRLQNPDGSYKAVTPDIAQSAIANWNASLKAFYRNPTYESASRAAIDAGVVSHLRETLDDAIHNATGANYQALKHQYGALSSIEKDVNKAAIMQAKQTGTNTSGLGKYVDVFSGGDMVSGLLSLNPALFAKGAAQAGISHFFQWLNSPDRAVSSMFKAASK